MPVSSPLSVTSLPSFDNSASINRLQQLMGLLDSSLRLPNTPRAFMIYLVGLAIVFAGAFMQVLVAAQIMQAELMLSQLTQEHLAIEQQNGDLIFKYSRDTSMARLAQRIREEGYVAVQDREYLFVPSETLATVGAKSVGAKPGPTVGVVAASTMQTNREPGPAAGTVNAATNPEQGLAADSIAPLAMSNLNNTHSNVQLTRWQEFWNLTWQQASGTLAGTETNNATNTTSAGVQTSQATPNIWSAWWEQATAQGSKLLEQFRSP